MLSNSIIFIRFSLDHVKDIPISVKVGYMYVVRMSGSGHITSGCFPAKYKSVNKQRQIVLNWILDFRSAYADNGEVARWQL